MGVRQRCKAASGKWRQLGAQFDTAGDTEADGDVKCCLVMLFILWKLNLESLPPKTGLFKKKSWICKPRRAEPSQHWTTKSSSLKFKNYKSASAVTFLCCLANTQVNEPHLSDWWWTNADTLRRVLGPFGSRCFPTFSNFILPALRFCTARRSDPRKMYNKVGLTERVTAVSHSGKPYYITGQIKLSLVHLLSQSGLQCVRQIDR